MIFVDSGAFFAAFCASDSNHARATAWLAGNEERLITTDYIVDETLTVLRARRQYKRAIEFGTAIMTGQLADIYWITPELFQAGWEIFHTYQDKSWSFTDCLSRVVMEELDIDKAFSFDDHFRQFGTVTLVP